jgi:hypothetical protein
VSPRNLTPAGSTIASLNGALTAALPIWLAGLDDALDEAALAALLDSAIAHRRRGSTFAFLGWQTRRIAPSGGRPQLPAAKENFAIL